MSLRTKAISLLDKTGVLDLAMFARRFVSLPYLPILTYHRIGSPGGELDDGVVDASREEFEKQVATLAKSFNVVGIDELRAYVVDRKPLPKNPAVISFDDGYRECEEIAVPVLKKHGVKGIFFISTDHMNDRKVFWWDRASFLVKRSHKARIEVEYPERKVYDLSAGKQKVINDILMTIKTTYALDVETYLQTLGSELDVSWGPDDEKRITDEVLMTWDGVRAMRKAGMDVQSHTRSHRVLQTLTPSDLESELVGSKKMLEKQLGEPICAIAYPVGYSITSDRAIMAAVRSAGYDIGFSNGTGLGKHTADPLDLQRLSVDPDLPHSYFRASVTVPRLAYSR